MTDPRSDVRAADLRGPADPDRPWGGTRTAPVRPAPPARPPLRLRGPGLLLTVLAVVALLMGVRGCVATTAVPAPGAGAPPSPGAGAPPAAGGSAADGRAAAGAAAAGSLLAGATSLFDAARSGDGGLAPLVGQTAIGRAVPVESVPADEGFWIGTGPTDRVWVQLTTDDESGITITAGQLLDLSGPLVSHGTDFAGKAGVAAQDGADQLTRQRAHLEVDPARITVVGRR